jgi:hypothetical protein
MAARGRQRCDGRSRRHVNATQGCLLAGVLEGQCLACEFLEQGTQRAQPLHP